ncbi:myo-inositol-1(or 4)-monophosphatase [Thermodesulfovibrio aggregans]|uniref:Inositol-1-monophosphatase n=1 Tax=Thermodesulfovibrio aggregans TaxID=86166 RepID=A0A0U9HWJ6_9BACT|nr:inositol monophosphatase family protein [Thermodesulfovibrio aggregans]GAQ94037.1 myo-inositol-1(or 4)-monophosphatase [Thermodesulfovibrio aggregans]
MRDYLIVAIEVAQQAGKIIKEKIGTITFEQITHKSISDYVTEIDIYSEKTIVNHIKKHFPAHQIMAEESSNDYKKAEYLWIIDPLDGTTNFIHGFPFVAISIALMYKGEIVLGVIHDPTRNETFYAELGSGAFLNGERIKVSTTNLPELSLIATGFPFRNKQYIPNYIKIFRELLYSVSDLRRAGAAAIDLAYVACGRVDGFFEFALSPWDIAAGVSLIKEAGGVVSDFEGDDGYLKTGHIIAGNPVIHSFLVNKINEVLKN